jgi:type II secretory pathway pseudopilin PulG
VKSPRPFRGRKNPGFGLLEVILVFAIVIGAAAVVFSVFQSAQPSAEVDAEINRTTTIIGNLRSVFSPQHVYTGLTNTLAIQAKAVPSDMIDPAHPATGIQSQWGTVTLGPSTCASISNGCIMLTYASVPAEACMKYASGILPAIPNAYVFINNVGTSSANGQINMGALAQTCNQAANSIMIVLS